MNLPRLIERNIRRNIRRFVLTATTVGLATFIFAILISVPASMNRIIKDASTTLRLVVSHRTGAWYGLPPRYCRQIREMPGCAACVALTGWPATYRDPSDTIMAFAMGPELAQVFPDYETTAANQKAMARERRGALVGRVLMAKHGWKIGQQITLRGGDAAHMELTFVIVGDIPSKRYPNSFVFRRDYFFESRKAAGLGSGEYAWNLLVRADSASHLAPLAKEIDENFRNSTDETRTVTESEALAGGLSAVGNIRAIVFSLSSVVILTVLLIAANSTAMMVRDRTSEVALMRTLGFSRLHISGLLFGECAAIGLAGGSLGAGLALWLFAHGVTLGAVLDGNGALWVTPWSAAMALAAALSVTLLSGVVPIWGALRIAPALGFRQVE